MATKDVVAKVPVEIDIDNKKLSRLEVEFQEVLQILENTCDSHDEFDNTISLARTKISNLKTTFSKFEDSTGEFEDEDCYLESIKPLIQTHRTIIKSLQISFQKSCINGQKRVTRIEKDRLLSDVNRGEETNLRKRRLDKTEVANKSAEITRNLINIAQMMDTQLKQGEESNLVLEGSSQQIKETHEEFKGLTGFINVSRKLLNKYSRRELTDTLLLFFGLILFFATVLYIISKRI